MAEICPFRALRYNPLKVGELANVITQPYDKISAEMQARYYALSPYNLVRIIRGRQQPGDTAQESVYTRARESFRQWREEGVLIPERQAALYPYYQEYGLPGRTGVKKQRRGFVALLHLEDYSARIVHRHEETLSGPKADRLELLKATRAHFGQIFLLYRDPRGAIETLLDRAAQAPPLARLPDEYGSLHSVWRVADAATIGQVAEAMREKKLVIADGHHRYETALAYRDYCRAPARADPRAEYVMATFVRMEAEGLTILPTHRVVHGLAGFDWGNFLAKARQAFKVEEVVADSRAQEWAQALAERVAKAGREAPAVGAYAGRGRIAVLRLRCDCGLEAALADLAPSLRRLDVVVLHRLLLEGVLGISAQAVREEKNLLYFRELEAAGELVDQGKAQICFLMNPTPIEAVRDNALAGLALPQKSTDFYPKLLSGLTIYWLDNPAGL